MHWNQKRVGGFVAALMLLAVAATVLLATPVAADSVTLPQNETFAVSNDTESLRVVAENMSGDLTTTVYDATNSSSLVEVTNGTLNSSKTTDSYTFSVIDAENVTHYKLSVDGPGAESVVLEKLEAISGGGGAMLPGGDALAGMSPLEAGGALAIILAVAYLVVSNRSRRYG
jgi:hypothetical protein